MMAATNRPDILDSALLRPGRFDRQIMVPLPTQEERVEILKVHFRDKKISPDVGVDVIARGTPGMSGADLSNLVNEAALFAVRRNALEVHKEDFDAARDRVLMGLRRESLALSQEEKEIVAFHEGGHAVCVRARVRRPAPQGDDPAHRHGPRSHPAAPARGAPHLQARVHRRLVGRPPRRARRRAARVRSPVDRRRERPRRLHGARPQDGARVGHVRSRRPDGVGFPGRGVPRRRPHALPRLLRRNSRDRPKRSSTSSATRRSGAARSSRSTAPGSTRLPSRCSSGRRSPATRSRRSWTPPWAARSAGRA